MINARSETLAEKPSFRTALKRHRCLIPADGFYEWKVTAAGGKQPIHIGMSDRSLFAFAGLTERWLSPAGEVLDTCTIITTQANALLATMHDRMPVIVAPAQYGRWLDVAVRRRRPLRALPCRRDDVLPGVHAGRQRASRRRDASSR